MKLVFEFGLASRGVRGFASGHVVMFVVDPTTRSYAVAAGGVQLQLEYDLNGNWVEELDNSIVFVIPNGRRFTKLGNRIYEVVDGSA